MAVVIGIDSANKDSFGMSNGGMAVFLSTIVLSGSRIATTKREKDIVYWFAEHDDVVRGRGCNGFDVCDIPWTTDNFEEEMEFMVRLVKQAKDKLGWETLNYDPPDQYIQSYLDSFLRLLSQFDRSQIKAGGYEKWLNEAIEYPEYKNPEGSPKCEKHGALLYWHGCIICNDE